MCQDPEGSNCSDPGWSLLIVVITEGSEFPFPQCRQWSVSPQSHQWSASSGSPARLGSCCLLGDSRSEVVMTTMLRPIKCSMCIIAEACFWLGILLLLSNSVLSWSFVCVKLLQPCLTLCYPMDCSLPGSSVHGILQARILECVAMSSSRESSWPRDRTCIS